MKELWMGSYPVSSSRVMVYNIPYTQLCLFQPTVSNLICLKPQENTPVHNIPYYYCLHYPHCDTLYIHPYIHYILLENSCYFYTTNRYLFLYNSRKNFHPLLCLVETSCQVLFISCLVRKTKEIVLEMIFSQSLTDLICKYLP